MCGLVGIIGDVSSHQIGTIFKDLLDVCQVRGRDSTGVVRVAPDGKYYDWIKQVGGPANLYDTKSWDNRIELKSSVVIGHTRSKTVGEISVKNAHPFDFPEEGIIGVHNGTLRNHHKLEGHAYNKVDSEILYNHLSIHGAAETFPALEGAYACVWWDQNTRRLNFIRNNERPLYFAWSKDCRLMFWASETWMFSVVRRKMELYSDKDGKMFTELVPHELWSFSADVNAVKDKPVITMYKPVSLPPKPVTTYVPMTGNFHTQRSWERKPDGSYVPSADSKGGEVTDPFSMLTTTGKDPDGTGLNDEIPDFLKRSAESKPSQKSNASSSSSSSLVLVPPVEPPTSNTSKRSTLSLPGSTSRTSPTGSNVVLLADSRGLPSDSSQRRFRTGVDHRSVGGIKYISSRRSGHEWASELYMKTSKGCCSFCKTTYTDPHDIAEIIDAKTFVCVPCYTVPAQAIAN